MKNVIKIQICFSSCGLFDYNSQIISADVSVEQTFSIFKKLLTLRLLMSYIYMEHIFLMFLDHTQRRSTVGRTPLDEWSARRRDLYLTTHDTHNRQISMPPVGFEPTISAGERPLWCVVVCDLESSRIGAPYIYDISNLRVNIILTLRLLIILVGNQYDAQFLLV